MNKHEQPKRRLEAEGSHSVQAGQTQRPVPESQPLHKQDAYLLDAPQAMEVKRDPNLKLAFSGGIGTFYLGLGGRVKAVEGTRLGVRGSIGVNYAAPKRARRWEAFL